MERSSLLAFGGFNAPETKTLKRVSSLPLTDITNNQTAAGLETPRNSNITHDMAESSVEDVPSAPLKHSTDLKQKSGKTRGKRLQFEDENSLQHIPNKREQQQQQQLSCTRNDKSKNLNRDKNDVPPPPNETGPKPYRSRKKMDSASHSPAWGPSKVFDNATTPQKKIPVLYGANVTVDSPDPMSKYNPANSTDTKSMIAPTALSRILSDCKAAVASPDSVVDDIYDFTPSSHRGPTISEVLGSNAQDDKTTIIYPKTSDMDEEDEEQLTSRIRSMRLQRASSQKNTLSRSDENQNPSKLVRTGAGSVLAPCKSASSLPAPSRSLDSLSPIQVTSSLSESSSGELLAKRPTPPPGAPTNLRRSLVVRPGPLPPSTSPSESSIGNPSTPTGRFNRSNGRKYTKSTVAENDDECSSPISQVHGDLIHESTSCGPQSPVNSGFSEHCSVTNVERNKQIEPENSANTSISTEPHPRSSQVSVSGCSRRLISSLLARAATKRKRRSKYSIAFTPKLECIPEEGDVELSFPEWVQVCPAPSRSCATEQSTCRSIAPEMEEYIRWILSQGECDAVCDQDTECFENSRMKDVAALFQALRDHDGSKFKQMIESDETLVYCRDLNGNTPLMIATLLGWRKAIKMLIKNGGDVNAQNRFGNTSLHFATAMDGTGDIQRYLVKKNALTTIRNERGRCSDFNSQSC